MGELLQRLSDDGVAPLPSAPTLSEASAAAAAPDLWARIRLGFRMPELETRIATQRTVWYASQPEYIARMTQRSSRYLYYIVLEIERRGLPTELALLPFVESAFQPEAVSSAKAAGLWQFIPSTGKHYELTQNAWRDERRDVIESTRAALDYLEKLYKQFGDWQLALAAYNWGEGSVERAIEKNRRAKKGTRYVDLKMPIETQHYVPKLQAMKNIVLAPERFGVVLPPIPNSPYFVMIQKTRDIDVQTAARLAEMPLEEFRALNPQFNRPVIPAAARPTLLLPADRAETFHANLAAWEATGQPLSMWTTTTAAPTDTLAGIAARAGISEAQLREANRIPSRYRLAPGSTLLIPRDETMDADITAASLSAQFAVVPESANLRKVTYRVRRGDTVQSIARRWNVEVRDIIVWNHLTTPKLFAGQRLELTVVASKKPAAPKPSASKPSDNKAAAPQSASAKPATPKPPTPKPASNKAANNKATSASVQGPPPR